MNVLIVVHDPSTCKLLRTALPPDEFALAEAADPESAADLIAAKHPDLILLDAGLPGADGQAVIEAAGNRHKVPIVVLADRQNNEEKAKWLEAGADDYVKRPFGAPDLPVRIRAALKRVPGPAPDREEEVFEFEHLKIDRAARKVWVAGRDTHLTPIEYKLLCVLVENAGKVVSHRQLLSEVWGAEYSDDTQYVRIYMGYLRRKIELADSCRPLLVTEPRVGYRLAV